MGISHFEWEIRVCTRNPSGHFPLRVGISHSHRWWFLVVDGVGVEVCCSALMFVRKFMAGPMPMCFLISCLPVSSEECLSQLAV